MTVLEQLLAGHVLNPTTTVGAIMYALAFGLAAVFASRTLRTLVRRTLQHDTRGRIDRTLAHFLTALTQISIFLLAATLYAHLIPELRALGTAVLAGVSVTSIIIAVAAQGTLSNLIAGIMLLLYRPFRVGDSLQISAPGGLETGVVEHLTLGYTELRAPDNRRIVVPNNVMASQVVINVTMRNPRALAHITLDAAAPDLERVRGELIELAMQHPLVETVVTCSITRLDQTHATLSMRVWCADAGNAAQVESDLYEQLVRRQLS